MSKSRFSDQTCFSKHPWHEYLFIASVCFGEILANAGASMAISQLFILQEDFGVSDTPPMIGWYSAAYGMAMGSVTLVSGQIGDVYGIKAMIMGGYVWTVIWSILCGISYYDRSHGPQFYCCARAFQGCGTAFVLPNILGAVGRVYAPGSTLKRIVFGSLGFCVPLALFLGPWFTGIIVTQTERWDWAYYAIAIFAFVSGIMSWISVPSLPPKLKADGTPQRVDWVGGTLAMGGLNLFAYAWNQAPVIGWTNASIITLLVIGVILMAAFIIWDANFAKDPLVPPLILKNKEPKITLVLISMFLSWGALAIALVRTQMVNELLRNYTPFASASTLAPMAPMGAIGAILVTFIISEKTVELVFFFSMLLFLAAAITLATSQVHESYWRNVFGTWILEPLAIGWSYASATIIMSALLPPEWQGLAGSFVSFTSGYGFGIFLGIGGVIQNQLTLSRPGDLLYSTRGVEYFGIGISGLAALIAFIFVFQRFVWSSMRARKRRHAESLDLAEKSLARDEETQFSGDNSHKGSVPTAALSADSISELTIEFTPAAASV